MNNPNQRGLLNKALIAISVAGVTMTFLLQEFSFIDQWNLTESQTFIARKIFRVFLNDVFMLLFIIAWFKDKSVTRLAIIIQMIDGLFLLPLYLTIKLSLEGPSELSSPLLSQFHRLIINPTLMILLIPAIYFQKSYMKR